LILGLLVAEGVVEVLGEVLIADPWLAGLPSGLVNSQLPGVPVMVMPPSWTAVWCHWHSKIRLQTLR
jgi:hypothetical protein